ncbi:tetratricopeptide repeat protein [Vibrio sp. OCN044]|uniref:Tetratricopeptide repeat protein n=1 Tax=Vibrio tetraodonis subsp. pristinus TaxID=2695891 RepID=A0A6L8LWY6_9VIBR|nr:tetratricopeptide repeat protein [Vibrio tetraodonis]MYM60638.1 tetratricopeptide repeat protein [Vibrio tetraodonis subsp. pristinus]
MTVTEKLRQYLMVDPTNSELALQLIESLAVEGKTRDALEFLQTFYNAEEHDFRFLAWSAHLHLALSQFENAIENYQTLFAMGHIHQAHQINCAYAYYYNSNRTAALDLLNECHSSEPEHILLKARCMSDADELAPVIEMLNETDFSSSNDKVVSDKKGLLSLLYLDNGDYAQAQKFSAETLDKDEENFDARLVKASLSLFKFDIENAVTDVNLLYNVYPSIGRVIVLKALLEMSLKNFVAALELYKQACTLMPEHVGTRVNLAWCHFLTGNIDLAEVTFEEAIKIDRTFSEGHGGLSLIKSKQEKWIESKELARTALKLDKNCASALFSRALYLKNIGRDNEANLIMNGLVGSKSEMTGKSLKNIILESLRIG